MSELTKIDLHSHTTASDGSCSPSDVVRRAASNNVTMLAITDHDSTEGLKEAYECIRAENLPLQLISGVEISTVWKGREIHIVGLNIDQTNAKLQTLLMAQKQKRLQRAELINAKLNRCGIENALEGAMSYSKGDAISRSHFARFLVDSGVVKTMQRAFKQYLGSSGRAYVPPQWVSMEEAIAEIHLAQGTSVLAHPLRYSLSMSWVKRLINDFKHAGGVGIEISQSRQTLQDMQILTKLATEYELLGSQGTDFHHIHEYIDLGRCTPLNESTPTVWQSWS